jgi:hypothetical protein
LPGDMLDVVAIPDVENEPLHRDFRATVKKYKAAVVAYLKDQQAHPLKE